MLKKHLLWLSITVMGLSLTACSPKSESTTETMNSQANTPVVIYTNADDEAKQAMAKVLNAEGLENQYIIQTFGTSELGGKLLAEGKNIEADVVTMSSYFLDGAQTANKMFQPIQSSLKPLTPHPDFYLPMTSQEGALAVNTIELEKQKLAKPTSLADLTKPEYKNWLAISDPSGSSTAWLMTQAIVSAYGDQDEGKKVMNQIIENAGNHVEQSGSSPLKKVKAGEVAIGFGLRQQIMNEHKKGKGIELVDPTEGNFSLVEGVAVVDKANQTKPLAQKVAQIIIEKGRGELIKSYPNALYEGEETNPQERSKYPKQFNEPLTTELLEKHKAFFHNKY